MAKPDLVVIGAIAGAHGVRGDAKVKPFRRSRAADRLWSVSR
jgi:ribosomal 30S subunit maturation factor RimM